MAAPTNARAVLRGVMARCIHQPRGAVLCEPSSVRCLRCLLVVSLPLFGCAGASPPETGGPTNEPDGPSSASAYVTGDYIVYVYDGRFSEAEVVLHEEVVAVEGIRLTIDVRASRGEEALRWIQVVMDTPENRENNVIDELYEVVDGDRIPLVNENNADLVRLYRWTLPDCGPSGEQLLTVRSENRNIDVSGATLSCDCQRQQMRCGGEPAEMVSCGCPDFVWTHAFAEVTGPGDDLPYWRMSVREHGRRTPGGASDEAAAERAGR